MNVNPNLDFAMRLSADLGDAAKEVAKVQAALDGVQDAGADAAKGLNSAADAAAETAAATTTAAKATDALETALESVEDAGASAAKGVDNLADASSDAAAATTDAAKDLGQLDTALEGVEAAGASAAAGLDTAANAGEAAAAAAANDTAAANANAAALNTQATAAGRAASEQRELENAHKRVTLANHALGRAQSDLATLQASGGATARQLEVAQDAVTRAELRLSDASARAATAQDRYNAALKRSAIDARAAAVSQAQHTQAMRQLPAQITDIVTGLASGQNPMMVMIQQGGQLKDSFGGVVPAARALLGALSPMVLAGTGVAAALGAVALGAIDGYRELRALERAVISTGNVAGVTAGQLVDLADRIGEATGEFGDADQAAQQLAASGKLSGDALESALGAAVNLAKLTGASIEDTTDRIIKLAEAPSAMLLKLNEQYHFLSAEVYDQVKALEQQGRTQEAATLAVQEFARVHEERIREAESRAGLLERAWVGVGRTISSVWDSLKSIGTDNTAEERVRQAQADLDNYRRTILARGGVISDDAVARFQAEIDRAKEALRAEQERAAAEAKARAEEEKKLREREAAEKAREAWDRLHSSNLTREQKLEQEIAEIRTLGVTAGKTEVEIEAEIAAARARATEGASADAEWDRLRISNLDRQQKLEEEIARIRKAGLAAGKSEAEIEEQIAQARARYQESLPKGRAPKKTDAERAQAAAERELENLTRQAALLGQVEAGEKRVSEEARVRYEIENGAFQAASAATHEQLIAQAQAIDAARAQRAEQAKQKKELEDTARAYEQLHDALLTPLEAAADQVTNDIETLNKALEDGIIDAAKYQAEIAKVGASALTRAPSIDLTEFGIGDRDTDQMAAANAELENWYAEQLAIINAGRAAGKQSNDYWDQQETAARQQHHDALNNLAIAQNQLQLMQASSIFGSMAEMAKTFGGEQSKTYQVLFAISKGFAVAQLATSLAINVAKASELGFPANIGTIAAAMAQGAQIASILAGAQFSGGGGQAFATGGHVRGPGTGTSDSIHAFLSDYEFVTRAAVVRQPGALPFLEDFNSRGMAALEDWQGFAEGGLVTAPEPRVRIGDSSPMQTSIANRMSVYLLQNEDELIERLAKHPRMEKAVVAIAGQNGQAIRAEW